MESVIFKGKKFPSEKWKRNTPNSLNNFFDIYSKRIFPSTKKDEENVEDVDEDDQMDEVEEKEKDEKKKKRKSWEIFGYQDEILRPLEKNTQTLLEHQYKNHGWGH